MDNPPTPHGLDGLTAIKGHHSQFLMRESTAFQDLTKRRPLYQFRSHNLQLTAIDLNGTGPVKSDYAAALDCEQCVNFPLDALLNMSGEVDLDRRRPSIDLSSIHNALSAGRERLI